MKKHGLQIRAIWMIQYLKIDMLLFFIQQSNAFITISKYSILVKTSTQNTLVKIIK